MKVKIRATTWRLEEMLENVVVGKYQLTLHQNLSRIRDRSERAFNLPRERKVKKKKKKTYACYLDSSVRAADTDGSSPLPDCIIHLRQRAYRL